MKLMILHGSILGNQKDIGFGIFQRILKNYSEDPQILIFAAALITNILIVIMSFINIQECLS